MAAAKAVTRKLRCVFAFPVKTRLHLWCDGNPGIHRERASSHFLYRDPCGKLIRDTVFIAKDFRTWSATVKAAAKLAELPRPETKTAIEHVICGVIKAVAAEPGNTPAVCRKSYVHPGVLEAFAEGEGPRPSFGR
jgi:DNA topoisomerase IB